MPHPFEDSIHFEYHKMTEAEKKIEVRIILNPTSIGLEYKVKAQENGGDDATK